MDPSLFDRSVPVLLVKVGSYPLHHGGLGLARSMGRVDVPVVAMVENPFTPLALSRHVSSRVGQLAVESSGADVLATFARVAEVVGCRPVAAATDDEAAVLLDEQRQELSAHVRIPEQRPGLARLVSSKWGLARVCADFGVASPATCSPGTAEELMAWADTATFPLVLKNREAFSRVQNPAVSATSVISSRAALEGWARTWNEGSGLVVQEYVPGEARQNLSYQAYRASSSDTIVSFTGVKVREWPAGRGETTLSISRAEPQLKAIGDRLLADLDYRGVCDLDFILDRRDGQYKLIDFNPRFGANAATFVHDDGLDLIRAYHLDLTCRGIPEGRQVDGIVFQVEPNDRRARRVVGGSGGHVPTVRAYRAADDPLPRIRAAQLRTFVAARAAVRRGVERLTWLRGARSTLTDGQGSPR